MRNRAVIGLLLLSGCGGAAEENFLAEAAPNDRIECRTGEGAGFERNCTVERSDTEQGRILTVRKPDGGFRRLLVTDDGRGVVAADGAEQAQVTIVGEDRIEVAIGGDIFRLPATVGR